MKSPTDTPRVILWDLETSNLDADFGFVLCAGWKVLGEPKVHLISIRDDVARYARRKTDDRYIVREMSRVLMDADMHITYNGKRYDWKWIQTRRFIHGWDLLPLKPHVDLLYTAKSVFRTRSKSLKHISTLDSRLKIAKTPVSGPQWVDAVAGDIRALKYVERHCIADVRVLEGEYMRLRPAVWMHPRMSADLSACKFCGSLKVQRRGYEITTLRNLKQRIQCQKCGAWDSRALPRGKA